MRPIELAADDRTEPLGEEVAVFAVLALRADEAGELLGEELPQGGEAERDREQVLLGGAAT